MNRSYKIAFNILLILLLSFAIGIIALFSAYQIPTESIKHHIQQSQSIYEEEGLYPHVLAINKKSFELDNFTDVIMLRNSVYPKDNNSMWNAMLIPKYSYDGNQIDILIKTINDTPNPNIEMYARYWHGYLIFLKPLLYITNIQNIRILNSFMQIILTIFTIILLWKRLGKGYAISYLCMYGALNPLALCMSFQYSTMYYIMSISSIILLYGWSYWRDAYRYIYVFFISGIVTAYFDLLTYPMVSLGVPLIIFICLQYHDGIVYSIKKWSTWIITLVLIWGIGYSAMYIGKWIIAQLITGYDVIENAQKQLGHRMSHSGSDNLSVNKQITLMSTILINIRALLGNYFMIPVLITFIVGISIGIWNYSSTIKNHLYSKYRSSYLNYLLLLGLTSLLPFMWYIAFQNHSYIHTFFTYRELAIFIFGIGCLITTALRREYKL